MSYTPEDDKIYNDFVLCVGQSNMNSWGGNNLVNATLDWQHDRIYQWPLSTTVDSTYANKLIKASDPMKWPYLADDPNAKDYWAVSPATWFARHMLNNLPVNRNLVLVPGAVGGTKLVNGGWAHGSTLYNNSVTAATNGINNTPNARLKYILWCQGEGDAAALVSYADYKTGLLDVLNGFRNEIPNAQDAIIIILGISPYWISQNPSATGDKIDKAQREMPSLLTNCWYVPGVPGSAALVDTVHYNPITQRLQGKRASDATNYIKGIEANGLAAPTDFILVGTTLSWKVPASNCPLYAIDYRLAGSFNAWTRILFSPSVYAVPGDTLSYNFGSVTESKEIRICGIYDTQDGPFTNTVTIQYSTIPQPFVDLDFDNASGTNVPNTGTSSTAFTADGSITTETINGKKVWVASNTIGLTAAVNLPSGAYTLLAMVKFTDFSLYSGIIWNSAITPYRYELWRLDYNKVGGGHNGQGNQVLSTALTINKWYVVAEVFDGTTLYLYVNGVLVSQLTASQWQNDVNGMMFNKWALSGTGGNTAKYRAGKVWTSALNQQKINQVSYDLANELEVTLG